MAASPVRENHRTPAYRGGKGVELTAGASAPEPDCSTSARRDAISVAATYEPYLARTLFDLGEQLAELGRHGEALTATEQAVEIFRRLAASHPDEYETSLATALSNLGTRLAELQRQGEVLDIAIRAVGVRRRLAVDNPTALRLSHTQRRSSGWSYALSACSLPGQPKPVSRRSNSAVIMGLRPWL